MLEWEVTLVNVLLNWIITKWTHNWDVSFDISLKSLKMYNKKLSHFKENKTTICTLKLASQVCEIKKVLN